MKWLSFSLLPGGTRNALAVEVYGKNINLACLHSIKGKPTQVDALESRTDSQILLGVNNVSWGLVSHICETAENLRRIGKIRFFLSAINCAFRNWRAYRAKVVYSNEGESHTVETDFQYVNLTNHKNPKIDDIELISPMSSLTDQKIDILMHPFSGRISSILYFRKIANFGNHVYDTRSIYTKIDSCTIIPEDVDIFNIDGEIYYSSQVSVKILPGFLKLITPS